MDKVSKIFLFTVSACALGRTTGTVMRELAQTYSSLEFETIYVDVQVEIANEYRVKTHPTTMFLDQEGNELSRIETFKETGEIIDLINRLNEQEQVPVKSYAENQMSHETYRIYLLQNNVPVPIEVSYLNKTSIKTPRITAIHLLLNTCPEGFENPFPKSTALEWVQFNGNIGNITLMMSGEDQLKAEKEKMASVLRKTLSQFGIIDVTINLTENIKK